MWHRRVVRELDGCAASTFREPADLLPTEGDICRGDALVDLGRRPGADDRPGREWLAEDRSAGLPATTWWPRSPRPATPTAGPPPRSPTMGGLHVALHRAPQRIRVPARLPRGPPEERSAGPPPDPGQDRALPPDPQALARAPAGGRHLGRTPGPARRLPPRLQRAAAASGDRAGHTRRACCRGRRSSPRPR